MPLRRLAPVGADDTLPPFDAQPSALTDAVP